MRNTVFLVGFFLLVSCSSTQFVDSWKNREIASFNPQKLLVVGITDNLTARKIFEEKLQKSLIQRGINAHVSTRVIDESFVDSKRSEQEIEAMTQELMNDGFDSVIVTAVKGVDDKTQYSSDYYTLGYRWYRFGGYWYTYQDVYYTPGYYTNYKVYHVETAIYNLKKGDARSLVWVGSFDIVNPQDITSTVDDYVARIIKQMDRENLINKL